MEIDFLGLNSTKYTTHQDSSKDSIFPDTWKGGVETSLSLSSSCLFDSQTKKEQQQQQQQQNWELPGASLSHYSPGRSSSSAGQPGLVLVSRPAFLSPPPASPFLYSLNDNPCSRKNMPKRSSEASGLIMFYPDKAGGDKGTYAGVPSDARIGPRGYTPTVAMARKATLARFLEKRVHRMNQARTTHVMGKLVNSNNPEVCNSSSTIISRSSNKKRQDSIIRL